MQGEGGASDLLGPLAIEKGSQAESFSGRVLFKQLPHTIHLSWHRESPTESYSLAVRVAPEGRPGEPSPAYEGKYTESFLQQLAARTGSPLTPRGLWELLKAAVKAAHEDSQGPPGDGKTLGHAQAAGAFLNLWSAADLEALKRRAGGEAPGGSFVSQQAADSKVFLIVTRAVERNKVHYPLALVNKGAAAAAAAAAVSAATAAADSKSLLKTAQREDAATEPDAAAAADASAAQPQQQHQQQQQEQQAASRPLDSSHKSQGSVLHPLPLNRQPSARRLLSASPAPSNNGPVDHREGPPQHQRSFGLSKGLPRAPQPAQRQQRWGDPGGSLYACTPSEASLGEEGSGTAAAGAAAAAAAAGPFQRDAGAAAELMRLRALVAEQQAALAEARRQHAACRQELEIACLRGDSADPHGLTAQLHRVEAELFMVRQRLQAERQLRARETQRFRLETDKMRKTETALRSRVRVLEAQVRANSCRLRRSAGSAAGSPAVRSASSRSSSVDSHACDRSKRYVERGSATLGAPGAPDAIRGNVKPSSFSSGTRVPPLYTRATSAGEGGPPRPPTKAPSTSSQGSRSMSQQSAARRGRSYSPFCSRHHLQPPCAGRSEGGPPRCHSGASLPGAPGRVSSSLLASTVSSRARQRSNSVGEGFGSSSSSSYGNYRSSFSTSSCACARSSLLACRAVQGPPGGPPGRHQAQQHLPLNQQPDWRLPPRENACSWKQPLRQHGAAVPLCRYGSAARSSFKDVAPLPGLLGARSTAAVSGYCKAGKAAHAHSLGLEGPLGGAALALKPHLVGCSMRGRSPCAAEARCEEDAQLPSATTLDYRLQQQQQQHQQQQYPQQRYKDPQQQPFVVLSAAEYERLSQRFAEPTPGSGRRKPLDVTPPHSGRGEGLPALLPTTAAAAAAAAAAETCNKQARESAPVTAAAAAAAAIAATAATHQLAERQSATVTTASAGDVSAEISKDAEAAPAPTGSSQEAAPSVRAGLPPLVVPRSNVAAADILGGNGCRMKPWALREQESAGTPRAVKAGRAVFSEIDERLTALQKFLRSTKESFRLLDAGTLGA